MTSRRKTLIAGLLAFVMLFGLLTITTRLLIIPQFTETEYEEKVRIAMLLYSSFFVISIATVSIFVWFVQRRIVQPIERIGHSVTRLVESGDLTKGIPHEENSELSELITYVNSLLTTLGLAQRDEMRYRTIINDAPEGIALVDSETRRFVQTNHAFQQLLGYSKDEIRRLNSDDVLMGSSRNQMNTAFIHQLRRSRVSIREISYRHKDGTPIDVEASIIYLQQVDDPVYCLIVRDITERKKAEAALRKSEEETRALIRTIPDNIVHMDRDGQYLNVHLTDVMAQYIEAKDLIGKNLDEVMPKETAQMIKRAIQRSLQTGKTVSIEYERVLNGHTFHHESRIAPNGPNHVIIIVRDVTERHKAEETIRYQASLVANVSDALIATDLNQTINSWNHAAEELYGLRAEEVLGKQFDEVMHIAYVDQVREQVVDMLDRVGFWQGEQLHHTHDGRIINVLASVSYVRDSSGKRVGTVGINRDITERKRAESLLLLAQKSESVSLLAGGIAHDFNNLLTGVLSQSSLALQKLSEEHSARNNIEKAIKASERAADLTRQLLAYTGQGAVRIETVNLNQLIQDNYGLIEAIVSKHTSMELKLSPSLPFIEIDRGHCQQVTMNLVINAIEAIDNRQGTVVIETGERLIDDDSILEIMNATKLEPGNYVYLKVSDNGAGMDQETLTRIFDPYFTTKKTGSGLGLSATLGIVQTYAGGLHVESSRGKGTTFTLFFPASNKTASVEEAPVEKTPVAMKGKTILVVDDEEPIRVAVNDILTAEGLKVFLADDGCDGLEKFREYQSEIDLILLDMQMPNMNGEDAFYALREIDPKIKIILSSGYNELEVAKQFQQQEPTSFLQKPYDFKMLLAIIRNAIQ